jgi:hypothetical protein
MYICNLRPGLYLGAIAGSLQKDLEAYREVLLDLEEQVQAAATLHSCTIFSGLET